MQAFTDRMLGITCSHIKAESDKGRIRPQGLQKLSREYEYKQTEPKLYIPIKNIKTADAAIHYLKLVNCILLPFISGSFLPIALIKKFASQDIQD